MAIQKRLVDGTQPLDAQERALNFMEQASFAKVINYAKSIGEHPAGTKANEAVLDDVPIGQQPPALHLEATGVGGDPTQIITGQLKAGRIVVFHEVGYVSGTEQMILGFR